MNPPLPPPVPPDVPALAGEELHAAPDPRSPLPKGTVVGTYTITGKLGQGGFGITYRARHTQNDTVVVLKEHMPVGLAVREKGRDFITCLSSDAEERFRATMREFIEEVIVLKGLSHPGIVPILDSFEANGTAYYVMPFIEGTPLSLPEEASLDHVRQAREALRFKVLLTRLLDAFEYLGQHNIVHRDIKPDNILITESGSPILLDFGSARQLQPDKVFTNIFTPDFCAPEQSESRTDSDMSAAIGPYTDLYALGATFYYLITRLLPPRAETRCISTPDPYVPLARRRDLIELYGKPFLQAVDRALEIEVSERWQSAAEWKKTIEEGLVPTSPRLQRRFRFLLVFGGLTIAALGTLSLWAVAKRNQALTLYHSSMKFSEGMLYDFNNELTDIPDSTRLQRKLGTHLRDFLDSVEKLPVARDSKMQRAMVTAWQNLGNVYVTQGDLEAATEALRNATETAQEMVEAAPDETYPRYELARIFLRRAEVARRRNLDEDSRALLSRAMVLLREVCRSAPSAPEYRCALGEAIGQTALQARRSGDTALQKKALDEMLAVYRRLVEDYPKHEESLKGLGYALQDLGTYNTEQGDFAMAAHLLEEEYNIFSELAAEHPYRLSFRKGLALSLYGTGVLYNRMGTLTQDEAQRKEHFNKALSAFRQHVTLTGELEKMDELNAEYPSLQCRAMAFMVDILLHNGTPNRAEAYSNEIMKKTELLLATAPDNADYALLRAGAMRGLAMAHSVVPRHAARAEKEFADYRSAVETLLNRTPGNVTLQLMYADALAESAAHALRQGNPASAREWLTLAETLLSQHEKTASTPLRASRLENLRARLADLPPEE